MSALGWGGFETVDDSVRAVGRMRELVPFGRPSNRPSTSMAGSGAEEPQGSWGGGE